MTCEYDFFEVDYVLRNKEDLNYFNINYFPNKETFYRCPPYLFLRKELNHTIQKNITDWNSYAKLHNLRHCHILNDLSFYDDVKDTYYSSIQQWLKDCDPTATIDDIYYGKHDMYPGVWWCELKCVLKNMEYLLENNIKIYHVDKKRRLC